jgi:hypothetical protein
MPVTNYTVLAPVPDTQWVAGLGQTVSGWKIPVYDQVVGNYVPVFVADANYTPANVEAAIVAAIENNRAVVNIGKTPPPAAA